MNTLHVHLGRRSYPVWVAPNLLRLLPERLSEYNHGQQWILVTQAALRSRFGGRLLDLFRERGYRMETVILPPGEKAKTLPRVAELYNKLLEQGCDRSSSLIALGGGVVGDVTGFVAATFMRGIPYFQVPTTLLAMVDSAIGGKTGVNLPSGKNLVGAFHQPRAVAVDPLLLRSLPERERISGLVEILKYGAIRDRDFFLKVGAGIPELITLTDTILLEQALLRSCAIKIEIVEQDELEGGLRQLLNFGHTIGHALEQVTGYNFLRHGEAVAYGILCAGYLSRERGLLEPRDWLQLQETLGKLSLPALPPMALGDLLNSIRRDKKVHAGRLHFVLLEKLGLARIVSDVSEREIIDALERICIFS